MWDDLILTAGSKHQKLTFEKQIKFLNLEKFCKNVEVVADEAENLRIGSGGSTIQIIHFLVSKFGADLSNKKILLCHSGGLSQRMPHLSAFGKVFARLGNGKTILETKLDHYSKNLVDKLPNGLMITASDVLENMGKFSGASFSSDFIIFAHESTEEIATQHGVFVLDEAGNLKFVLQKPTIEELKNEKAVRSDGNVLTDSCFFISWPICLKLAENFETPISEELCCYGDFMRPLGYAPKLEYIEKTPSPGLKRYRQKLAEIFCVAKNLEIINLGRDSFFHFGTFFEFFEHLENGSKFTEIFGKSCNLESNFLEFSKVGDSCEIGKHSLGSGLENPRKIPENVAIFTLPIIENGYLTAIFKIDDDIKKYVKNVKWNGHSTEIVDSSLWNAAIFKTGANSREESVNNTLDEWENGLKLENKNKRISIADAVRMHDIDRDLEWRAQF